MPLISSWEYLPPAPFTGRLPNNAQTTSTRSGSPNPLKRPRLQTVSPTMKRIQDKQGGRDQADDEEAAEPSESENNFKKAIPAILANRPIKGLPKRSGGMNTYKPPEKTTEFKFQGFTPPPLKPFTSNPFASTNGNSSHASSSKPFQANPTPSTTPLGPSPTMPVDEDNEQLLNYRGLNQSFVESLKNLLKDDPFADVSALLKQYQSMRGVITKSRENSRSSFASGASMPSMPKPPPAFAWPKFNPTEGSSASGFKPDFSGAGGSNSATSSNPFSFKPTTSTDVPDPAKSTSTNPPSTFTFGNKDPPIFQFNPTTPSTNSSGASSTSTPASNPFNFGSTSTSSNPFSFPTTGSAPSKEDAADSSKVPPTSTTEDKGKSSGSSPFSFPSSSNSTATSLFGKPSTSAVAPAFGKSASSSSSGSAVALPFGAGSPSFGSKSSLNNSVGFGFGSHSKETDDEANKETHALIAQPSSSSELADSSARMTAGQLLPAPSVDGALMSRDVTPLSEASGAGDDDDDEVYEGEEDEITLHTTRCRVSLRKAEKGGGEWKSMGTGRLKLKKHTASGKKRLLHRETNSKRVVINALLFPGMKTTSQGKTFSFGVLEDGGVTMYSLRLASEEDARALKNEVDKEVASLTKESKS